MEQRRPPEYILEVFADPTCVKDVVKAIMHTIFFHRYFIPIRPLTRDLLDLTLPAIDDVDLETLIDQRVLALIRQIDTESSFSHQSGRGQIAVQFFEKRRRKTYFSFGKGDEEVCWEQWLLDVTLATPRTETGLSGPMPSTPRVVMTAATADSAFSAATSATSAIALSTIATTCKADVMSSNADVVKMRRAMEKSLQKTALKIVNIVNRDKDHIPPITTTDANPFPYHIIVNPRNEGWNQRMGIF